MIPHTEHLEQLSAAVARIGTLAIAPEQPYAARGGAYPVAFIAVAHDDGTYSTHTAVLPPGRFPYVVAGFYGLPSIADAMADVKRRDGNHGGARYCEVTT